MSWNTLKHIKSVVSGMFTLAKQQDFFQRHANVSTTAAYYIKPAADDLRDAMAKLEKRIAGPTQTQTDTTGTLDGEQGERPKMVQ